MGHEAESHIMMGMLRTRLGGEEESMYTRIIGGEARRKKNTRKTET
jgi:hypothetical protein